MYVCTSTRVRATSHTRRSLSHGMTPESQPIDEATKPKWMITQWRAQISIHTPDFRGVMCLGA